MVAGPWLHIDLNQLCGKVEKVEAGWVLTSGDRFREDVCSSAVEPLDLS